MTPRMTRGLRISALEEELRERLAEIEAHRGTGRGRRDPELEAQVRAVRAELKRLAAERRALLAQIERGFAQLRVKQAEFDRARAAARAAGRRGRIPVSKEERRLRRSLAVLQRERAYVDGSVYRDRKLARSAKEALAGAVRRQERPGVSAGPGDGRPGRW
jgi:chromosome segregation ATPase